MAIYIIFIDTSDQFKTVHAKKKNGPNYVFISIWNGHQELKKSFKIGCSVSSMCLSCTYVYSDR